MKTSLFFAYMILNVGIGISLCLLFIFFLKRFLEVFRVKIEVLDLISLLGGKEGKTESLKFSPAFMIVAVGSFCIGVNLTSPFFKEISLETFMENSVAFGGMILLIGFVTFSFLRDFSDKIFIIGNLFLAILGFLSYLTFHYYPFFRFMDICVPFEISFATRAGLMGVGILGIGNIILLLNERRKRKQEKEKAR